MMTYLHALVLGLVEGITEFLPISSTGHLILAGHVLGISGDFLKTFEIFIQLGAILAVVVLYFKKLLGNWKIFSRVAVAFVPTAVLGLALYKVIKTYLLGSTSVVLWSLLVGGIALVLFERARKGKSADVRELESISYKQALLVGLCQSVAMIPGISRSAATIVGGLALGISREAIVEFSFLLAVPTMAAATGLDLIKSAPSLTAHETGLLGVGFITAFVSALLAVRFFIRYVQKHNFTVFGIYRILLALGFLLVL
jgi:undecaprenyl-diphosphatase